MLAADGAVLAASGDPDAWGRVARGLLAAADAAAGAPVAHAHVGTEDGEVFALRQAGLAIVAVSERFVLASLMLCDMRAALREVAVAGRAGAPAPEARVA